MADRSVMKRFTLTIIRIPIKNATREEFLDSPQWFELLDAVLAQPERRFIMNGWEVDNDTFILFVGWNVDTTPSPALSSKGPELHELLAPIHSFYLPEELDIQNMYRDDTKFNCRALECQPMPFHPKVMEMITVRGPKEIVEPEMKEIQRFLRGFLKLQLTAAGFNRMAPSHPLDGAGWCFRHIDEDDNDKNNITDAENDTREATFTVFIRWGSRQDRLWFQDPTIPNPNGDGPQWVAYATNKWETRVGPRLRSLAERGCSVSSLDYTEVAISRTRGPGPPEGTKYLQSILRRSDTGW